jgi:hypothetical protein
MQLSKLVATGFAVAALAVPALGSAQDPKPGEWKIPGTSTTLKLNGFVEMDATYDFDGSDDNIRGNDWASFLEFQPLDEGETQKKQLYLTMKTSRIGLTTTTPTGWGNLNVRVEGDFNSPSPYNFSTEATTNGVTFRMRHAYGEVGGLLIGQTWSNFNDLGSFPDTVEFNGHGAFPATRQPMIRYALPVGAGSLALSVENPQSLSLNTVLVGADDSLTVGRRYDRLPDATVNFTMPLGSGHVSARAVALEYNSMDAAGVEAHGFGWGAGLSGSFKFAKETLVWGVSGGDGIGRYLFQTLFQGGAQVGDDIETWKALAYHVGLTHAWSDTIRSNLIVTQTFIEENDALVPIWGTIANKRIDAGYVNTFVSPLKNFEVGLEYAYGRRTIFASAAAANGNVDNDEGTQHRANALFRYSFF